MRRPAIFDKELIDELKQIANSSNNEYQTILGGTMSCVDFYECQSRLDGAICGCNEEDKRNRLQQLHEAGIVNIEMEVTVFASMCRYVGIEAAVVSVTLVDRLDSDQIKTSKSVLEEYQLRPQKLVLSFIKKRLAQC